MSARARRHHRTSALLAWLLCSASIVGCGGQAPAPPSDPLVAAIQADLDAMVTNADGYLRTGTSAALTGYERASTRLPQDMAALARWGDGRGDPYKTKADAFVTAAQDEAQLVEAHVATAEHPASITYGYPLARSLDAQLRIPRVRLARARLDLADTAP